MAFPPSVGDGIVDGTTNDNKAFWDAYDVEVVAALKDTTSGGGAGSNQTPALTTAEVVDARGSMGSLGARISSVVSPDGSPIGVVTPASLRNGFVLGNLLANDSFMMWSRGDAAAPDFWTLSGAGATIARCGVGQADTRVVTNQDHFSAKLTFGAAPAMLLQNAIETVPFARAKAFLDGKFIPVDNAGNPLSGYDTGGIDGFSHAYMIAHVWCDGTNRAVLDLSGVPSSYHPGDSAWHSLIAGPVQFGSPLSASCNVDAAGAAYFQCVSVILTPLGLAPMYIPGRARYGTYTFPIIATPAAATGYGYLMPARPIHVLGLTAYAATAVPTGGTTLKLDLMTPISGTFQSLFSTLPAFVASDYHAIQACDPAAANYRRRTIRGPYAAGAAILDNSVLRLDVNARDSGNTGAGIVATVHYLEYERPLDQFRSMTDLGE